MPVSLQPRAPLVCAVVEPARKRPVSLCLLGYRVRPRRLYQVQVVAQQEDDEPDRVVLVAPSSLRCDRSREECTTVDGRCVHWLGFEPVHQEGWPWYLRGLFSRLETLTVRLDYADGRDDYVHSIPLVVVPTRAWVFWSLFSVAMLYFASALMSQLLKLEPNLPVLRRYFEQLLQSPAPWLGFAGLVLGPWVTITMLDRLILRSHLRRWRRENTERRKAEIETVCEIHC
jgi:hypothetical protein